VDIMAARDQATFMETLLAFKRALKRKAYGESTSLHSGRLLSADRDGS